jgi:hypothetical protein
MPAMQTVLTHLNDAFSDDEINETISKVEEFAVGKQFSTAIATFLPQKSSLAKPLVSYVENLPRSLQEGIRSIIHYALSTSPPTRITFAWAPNYDFELTIWQAPDTSRTRGGITVLLKSRYPADTHPLLQRTRSR